jgi:hypothetical protein
MSMGETHTSEGDKPRHGRLWPTWVYQLTSRGRVA